MTRSRSKLLQQRQSSARSVDSHGSDSSSVPHLLVETVDEKNEEDAHLLRGCVRDTYEALKPLSDDGTIEENVVKDMIVPGSIALFESRQKDRRHQETLECMRECQNRGCETGVLFELKGTYQQARSDITFRWAVAAWVKMGACVAYGLYGEGPAKPVTTILYQVMGGFWDNVVGTCPVQLTKDYEIEADEVFNVTTEPMVEAEPSWYASFWTMSQNSVQETVQETVVGPIVETIVEPISRSVQCGGYMMANAINGIILLGCVLVALRHFFGPDMASQAVIFLTVGAWVSAMDISWTVPYVVIGMAFGLFWHCHLHFTFRRLEKQMMDAVKHQEHVDQDSLYMDQHELEEVALQATYNFCIWCCVHMVTLFICSRMHTEM